MQLSCRCLGTFKVEGGVFFQQMVPVIQPHPAGVTQIGRAQLVACPQGFRMRISGRSFDSLGLRLFQKLQTHALHIHHGFFFSYQVLKSFRSWKLYSAKSPVRFLSSTKPGDRCIWRRFLSTVCGVDQRRVQE